MWWLGAQWAQASLWECGAAHSRQARPQEAQGPSSAHVSFLPEIYLSTYRPEEPGSAKEGTSAALRCGGGGGGLKGDEECAAAAAILRVLGHGVSPW